MRAPRSGHAAHWLCPGGGGGTCCGGCATALRAIEVAPPRDGSPLRAQRRNVAQSPVRVRRSRHSRLLLSNWCLTFSCCAASRRRACARSGTLNVIEACKQHGVRKIVMSSSPSTRFDGNDICGKAADELPIRCAPRVAEAPGAHAARAHLCLCVLRVGSPPGKFLQAYAETKAMGEARAAATRAK